jgi:hypothetical protein
VSGSSWRTVAVRAALLLLFPAGLLLLRFLRPEELADIRKLLSSVRRSSEPVVSVP